MSADLATLISNEVALADALLPADDDVTIPLTQQDQFLTHAYLVLACAVIEEFLEDCFERHLAVADTTNGKFAGCYVSLSARFADDLLGQNGGVVPTADYAAPVLRGLYSSKIVRPNNGLKQRNLEALAKPLGLRQRLEDECEALLGPADALGAKRGVVAHSGAVTEEIRPAKARALVKDMLDQLPLLVTMLTS